MAFTYHKLDVTIRRNLRDRELDRPFGSGDGVLNINHHPGMMILTTGRNALIRVPGRPKMRGANTL